MPPHHVAIVAMGPSLHQYVGLARAIGSRQAFCDEVWGINAMGSVIHCDRIFHMDDVRIQAIRAAAEPDSNIANMLAWLRVNKTPCYTSRSHPDYPSLVDFPLEQVLNRTGGMPYFNSTPAYAVALAIAEGVKVLSLFGLDYTYANAHDAERGRACVEFWLGRAHALGIDLRVSDRSSLLDSCEAEGRMYGYGRLSSITPDLVQRPDGSLAVSFAENATMPDATEIERAYDHSRHPSPLVSGVTQPEE